jgi:hypothetical protein
MRPALKLLLLLAVALAPAAAHAQFGTGGTTGSTPTDNGNSLGLTKDDFEITVWQRPSEDNLIFLNAYDLKTFFNRARCDCETPILIKILPRATARQKIRDRRTATVKVRIGTADCVATGTNRNQGQGCTDPMIGTGWQSGTVGSLVDGIFVRTTVRALFAVQQRPTGVLESYDCNQPNRAQSIWLWVDADQNSDPDMTDASLQIQIDGQAPAPADGVEVRAGQEALEVSWQPRDTTMDDQGFIVFCSRGGDTPVFKPGSFSPPYASIASICGQPPAAALTAGFTYASEVPLTGQSGSAPPQFRFLDPAFACSGILSRTETSYRIKTLQNDIPYLVGVASVDISGNASPIDNVLLQLPVPTRDFYRGYREAGGSAGGGCALAKRGARDGAGWILAGGVPLAALLLWRRRRRRGARP